MRSRPAPLLLLAALLAPGCSYTFDGTAPEVQLQGDPVPVGAGDRLNDGPVRSYATVEGADGKIWLSMLEYPNTFHLVRLTGGPSEEVTPLPSTTKVYTAYRTFYFDDEDPATMQPTVLHVRRAGEPPPGREFDFPPGTLKLHSGGADDVFAAWTVDDSDTGPDATLLLAHRDGSFQRTVPLPSGATTDDTSNLRAQMFFAGGGAYWVIPQGDGTLRAESTVRDDTVELGMTDQGVYVDDGTNSLVLAGTGGIRRVPLDGSAPTVFEPNPVIAVLGFRGRTAIYRRQDSPENVWEVSVDGNDQPMVVFTGPMARLWFTLDKGRYAYSLDNSSTYVKGAGDGWLDGTRFMERGLGVSLSRDGKRLRFLEHAATTNGAGELTSEPFPFTDQPPLRIALNVVGYSELSDGRLVVASNQAFLGAQNRLILVDERIPAAWRFVEGARGYGFIPGDNADLLALMVSGPYGIDIAKVAIPPEPAAATP